MSKIIVDEKTLKDIHRKYKILQKRNVILSTFFACVSIAVDSVSEANGWSSMVFEIRRQVEIAKRNLALANLHIEVEN